MSQPSVASFFNTRKRPAVDDILNVKTKQLKELPSSEKDIKNVEVPVETSDSISQLSSVDGSLRTRSGRTVKRTAFQLGSNNDKESATTKKPTLRVEQKQKMGQPKLVKFIKKGPMSPCKSKTTATSQSNEQTPEATMITKTDALPSLAPKNTTTNLERGMQTPTKQIIKTSRVTPLKHGEIKSLVKKELNFDEVKTKLSRSAKLQELKASLNRIKELEQTRKAQEEHNRCMRNGGGRSVASKDANVVQLKEFHTIEVEILTSPVKCLKTPTKLKPPATPDKNELMSPRHTDISKRLVFSPSKNGSPSKLITPQAYQRFMSLTETSSRAGQLPLPYKYRHLIEIFKGVDSVCAMFHNRRECITFKKLKPAVQRMLRKNFNESHLAQIKHLYPDAFLFTQMKMRNFGSTSKADYFQLVITPNVGNGLTAAERSSKSEKDDNVIATAQNNAMNPHIMTERLRKFQCILLARIRDQHDTFLRSLTPPLAIPKDKVTRWHPDFDLENCTDIELGHLPQPPNIEKYSSARDILTTARNLFNCATPMERAMERYEGKLIEIRNARNANANDGDKQAVNTLPRPLSRSGGGGGGDDGGSGYHTAVDSTQAAASGGDGDDGSGSSDPITATLLKGIPKSLIEKIRAKQAAKALDAMTRRPSQDREATKYSRMPELARHLRNVFVTEKKSILTLETVIKKIQNSYRTPLTAQEIEVHLQLMSKEVPDWLSLHEVRKSMYLKIQKDMDLSKVVERLEEVANKKSK